MTWLSKVLKLLALTVIMSRPAVSSEGDARKYSATKIRLMAETRIKFAPFSLDFDYEQDQLPSLTMYEPAPGELQIRYRGALAPIVKHIRGRFRRLCDNAFRDQMDYMTDSEIRRLNESRANAWNDLQAGGRWWERSWRQSRLLEKGGAARLTHYDGSENSWRLWHLTVTNSLKLKFDYAAMLELDTDSTADVDPRFFRSTDKQRVTVDISPVKGQSEFLVNVRFSPRLSIGLPDRKNVVVRSFSVRTNIDVFTNRRQRVVAAVIELGVRDHDDAFCSLSAALVSW